jgi:hypothetical protein
MLKSSSNIGFLDFVYNIYKELDKHDIILSYEGDINHQIMKAFTDLVEENMTKINESEALQIKVYHVIIECLQNINKHGDHPENESQLRFNRGIFLLSRNKHDYFVTTGNYIMTEKIEELTRLLNMINSHSKKQLNELYKKQLKEGHLSEKGGAGLGLIDIRRKTGNLLESQFLPVSDSHAFYLFTSKVPRTV